VKGRHVCGALLTLAFIAAQAASVCNAATGLVPQEGFVQVPGGPVWYRVFGSGTATPLLIVHGGPGRRSCYYDPLAERMSINRPVVVYDQLGTGRSGRPTDRSLWTAERSVRELAAVRKALGLRKVHLMGHSWGGAVVADYAISNKASGVESLVLAAPLLSTRIWIDDANALRTELPKQTQEILRRNEQAGTVKSKEYEDATKAFYDLFVHHRREVKLPDSCAQAPINQEMYESMWGPTEFNATGTLRTFDVTPRLGELTMPTMIVVGRYDEVRVETAEKFRADIPGSNVKVIENSGHMAPLDAYDTYSIVLEDFFRAVDRASR
jgi:proline iminopeptidase